LLQKDDIQIRQDFCDYLSRDVESSVVIEKAAKEKIIKIILSESGFSLQNSIDYFKYLVRYMQNKTRARPDDRIGDHPEGGQYVYYPVGSKAFGKNYVSNLLMALYFCVSEDGSSTIYDFGYRQ